MKRGVIALVSCLFLISFVSINFVSAYDLGPLIDQGLNAELVEENASDTQGTYRGILEEYYEQGLDEQALQEDVEGVVGDLDKANTKSGKKTISLEQADKEIENRNRKNTLKWRFDSKDKGFWDKFLDYVNSLVKGIKKDAKGLTGNVISEDFEIGNLELPEAPEDPVDVNGVLNPNLEDLKIVSFITGNAIVGLDPNLYNDGEEANFILGENFLGIQGGIHHFDLAPKIDVGNPNDYLYNRAVVWSKAWILNEKQGKWQQFSFEGTELRQTDWLLNFASGFSESGNVEKQDYEVSGALTISDYTDNDYAIFLAYACRKPTDDSPWECNHENNQPTWTLFVVETGNINYHLPAGEVPPLNFVENRDLDVSGIPSLLEQLGQTAYDTQPRLDDVLLFEPEGAYNFSQNEIGNIEFVVKNIGNRNLEEINYEVDIGEKALADVLNVQAPSSLAIGEEGIGTVSIQFKERGNWKFHLSVVPTNFESDTTDNFATFNVTVGAPITLKKAIDSIGQDWNRQINKTIKELYTKQEFNVDSGFYVVSGTDKVRTVFGEYRKGSPSDFPRAEVEFRPIISSEAIRRDFFVSALRAGMRLSSGDKEVVTYYLEITDSVTKKIYKTPLMESNFIYNYKPKELIPDLEFCREYTIKTKIVSNVYDNLLIQDPTPMKIISPACAPAEGEGKEIEMFRAHMRRILKLDGDYVVITSGSGRNIILDLTGEKYRIELRDPQNSQIYKINNLEVAKTRVERLENIIPRQVDFQTGEVFKGEVFFGEGKTVQGTDLSADLDEDRLTFEFDEWIAIIKRTVSLPIKDELIRFSNTPGKITGSRQGNWNPSIGGAHKENSKTWPNYMDKAVIEKIRDETRFDYVVKDTTTGEEIYHAKNIPYRQLVDCVNCDYVFGSSWFIPFTKDTAIGKSPLGLTDALNFTEGHFYEFYPEVVSSNKNLYAPINKIRFYYVDPYQFIANNPLLRTRFLNLQNAPQSIVIAMGDANTPEIAVTYTPVNLAYNSATKTVEKTDISQREIKLSEIMPISDSGNGNPGNKAYRARFFENPRGPRQILAFSGGDAEDRAQRDIYWTYQNDGEYIYPVYDKVTIQITPVSIAEIPNVKKTLFFNCKIGRYDGVCFRGNYGYDFIYFDEVNGQIYTISLWSEQKTTNFRNGEFRTQSEVYDRIVKSQTSNFLKRYRDNPSLYDSVIYDILSEIDRNPVTEFDDLQHFEKRIDIPNEFNFVYPSTIYSDDAANADYCEDDSINRDPDGYLEDRGDYPLHGLKSASGWPDWHEQNGDYYRALGSLSEHFIKEIGYKRDPRREVVLEFTPEIERYVMIYEFTAKVKDFESGNIIAQKKFEVGKEETKFINKAGKTIQKKKGLTLIGVNDIIAEWFESLDLGAYKRYSIQTEFSKLEKQNHVIGSFPIVFTYRPDYVDLILNKNGQYVKRIEELNSTIWSGQFVKASCSNLKYGKRIDPLLDTKVLNGLSLRPQQWMYDTWQANEFFDNGPFFTATFIAEPRDVEFNYEGEQITEEEFLANAYGERRLQLASDKAYLFEVYKMNNIYDWFSAAPRNDLNTLDTDLQGVICYGSESGGGPKYQGGRWLAGGNLPTYNSSSPDFGNPNTVLFALFCRWANIDDLAIYSLQINKELGPTEGITQSDIINNRLPVQAEQAIREYAETVLAQYLEWYPPTNILNTTFQAYY